MYNDDENANEKSERAILKRIRRVYSQSVFSAKPAFQLARAP